MPTPSPLLVKPTPEQQRNAERKAVHVVAQLIVGDRNETVVCGDLSTTGCMLKVSRPLNPKTRIALSLYVKNANGQMEMAQPISAIVRWFKPGKTEESFFVGVQFNHEVNVNHGVLQILYPERFQKVEKRRMDVNNNCLMGNYVQCFVCGQSDIALYTLRAKTMQTKSNIFGIPVYVKPMPGKDMCDFNLVQVTVCPNCFFASNSMQYFQSESGSGCPFEVGPFYKTWKETIPQRKQMVQNELNSFFSENRSLKQAIVSYQLAIATHEQLAQLTEGLEHPRKVISLQMVLAELLMTLGDRKAAEDMLKQAAQKLEKIFGNLQGEVILRSAMMLALIKLYFKEMSGVGQYMGFIRNYDTEGKLDATTPEGKMHKIALEMMSKVFQDREKYVHDKLKSFHIEE